LSRSVYVFSIFYSYLNFFYICDAAAAAAVDDDEMTAHHTHTDTFRP